MNSNPLSQRGRLVAKPPEPHPMLAHAQMWRHVQSMGPDDVAKKTDETDYTVPILAALAHDPNVTAKDVINAAADAAGEGKIGPSQAVQFISGMPADPDKLVPWLRSMYLANLTANVHLKAAQIRQQAASAAPAVPGGPALALPQQQGGAAPALSPQQAGAAPIAAPIQPGTP